MVYQLFSPVKEKKKLHEKYRKASLSCIKVPVKLIRKLTTIGKLTFFGHSPSAKKQNLTKVYTFTNIIKQKELTKKPKI